MFKKLNNKGYNLMELIVVIIIIGVLVAMAVPKYLDHKKDADAAVLQADIKTVQNAADIYDMTAQEPAKMYEDGEDGEEVFKNVKLKVEEVEEEIEIKGAELKLDVLKSKEGNIKSIKNNDKKFYRTEKGDIFVNEGAEKANGDIVVASPGVNEGGVVDGIIPAHSKEVSED